MSKKSASELGSYWQDLSERFGSRREQDPNLLSVVCHPGMLLCVNAYFDFFQRRAVEHALSRLRIELRGRRVLDVGCGGGRWSVFFRNRGCETAGIDIQKQTIQENRRVHPGVDFQVMSVTDLAFRDNWFDIVSAITVLQHLPHEAQTDAVGEIARVLRPDGWFLLLEFIQDSDSPHMFPRRVDNWQEALDHAGLSLVSHGPVGYDFAFRTLTHLLHSARKGLRLPEQTTDTVSGAAGRSRGSRHVLRSALFALTVIPSYPLEYLCSWFLPSRLATHQVMMYRKRAASASVRDG